MTLLITGGGGFVMSNLARKWLDSQPDGSVVVLVRDLEILGRRMAVTLTLNRRRSVSEKADKVRERES